MYLRHPLSLPNEAASDATRACIRSAHLHRECCQINMTQTHQTPTQKPSAAVISGTIVKSPRHRRSLKSKVPCHHGKLGDTKESMKHHHSVLKNAYSVSKKVGLWMMLVPMSRNTAEVKKRTDTW